MSGSVPPPKDTAPTGYGSDPTGCGTAVRVADWHLDRRGGLDAAGPHRRGRVLVRLHGLPLGELDLPLTGGGATRADLLRATADQLGRPLADHLRADGIAPCAAQDVPVRVAGGTDAARGAGGSRCRSGERLAAGAAVRATVVVATRDRAESLVRTLNSLARLDHPAFDVVVVDSAPSDGGTALLFARASPWPFRLTYRATPVPGLAVAHNHALPAVTGEVVAFTDDDVEVDAGWLGALASAFADPAVVCATGLILPAELETPAQLLVEEGGGFTRGFDRRVFDLALGAAGNPAADPLFPFTAGRFGSGANMAFRTSWLRGHGFDPATGAGTLARGGDDLLAFLQAVTSGGRLVYEPAAVLRHWHRRDVEGLRRQSFGYGVGLGAYLAAAVRHEPRLVGAMVRRGAPAVRHLVSARSPKNAGRTSTYPRDLVWRERLGVLVGPAAYTVSRRRARNGGRDVPTP